MNRNKYKNIKFIEPDNGLYQKIKKTFILSLRELEFVAYLARLQPCTVSDILEKIEKETEYSSKKIVAFNKITAPLKIKGIIQVVRKKKIGKKPQEIIQLNGNIPKRTQLKKKDHKLELMIKNALNSVLLSVEIYNKPKTSFRTENFIILMHMAWNKIILGYFIKNNIAIYEKDKNNAFIITDEEKKTWSLEKCINKYDHWKIGVKENLIFFNKLRRKIVHSNVSSEYLDVKIFGQCQSLVHNFEDFLKINFKNETSLDIDLVFSLQFSKERNPVQWTAIKESFTKEARNIKEFMEKYNNSLSQEVYNSQEYSYKIALRPYVPSSGRNPDCQIIFIKEPMQESDLNKITVVEKLKKIQVINPGELKPSSVVSEVKKRIPHIKFTQPIHTALLYIFSIRPITHDRKETPPEKTNTKYCHYHDPTNYYVYTNEWVSF